MSLNTMTDLLHCPKGFETFVANVGIRDESKDFVCIVSKKPCAAAAVFTQSCFAGPSVVISRQHIKNGQAQAIVAISKNANVATGEGGLNDANMIIERLASELSIEANDILIASTGVIGRRYPMDRIMQHLDGVSNQMKTANFIDAAHGIMTTDLVPKYCSVKIGNASLIGIAKGVGMMEPNMATLLTFFMTDAAIEPAVLDALFRRAMDKSFNCLSIDTDTSTSDTAVIMANGMAGEVDLAEFESALDDIAQQLVKAIARDGEGATKMLEVTVEQARDYKQAKQVAKLVVNSPLVKTAVHGADPNWGRVAMAIGKCEDSYDIKPENVSICFGSMEVYPHQLDDEALTKLEQQLKGDEVKIHIRLGINDASATVWGCDLSSEYVRINGEYST